MFTELIMEDISIERKKFCVLIQKEFIYENEDYIIKVFPGFDYDLASIPKFAQSIISKVGVYDCAATIHDWLYSANALERKECDKIFLQAMKESGVDYLERTTMYSAVRGFASFAYKCSEEERLKYSKLGQVIKKVK